MSQSEPSSTLKKLKFTEEEIESNRLTVRDKILRKNIF